MAKHPKRLAHEPEPTKVLHDSFVEYLREHGGNIGKVMARLTAEKARTGDTDAAFSILRDFVGAIDQYDEGTWSGLRSAPIHWEYVRYIADAFERVIRAAMRSPTWRGKTWSDVETGEAQADANLALGIKSSKPGRRKGAKTYETEALAALYWYLVRRGFKPERANKLLRERIGCDRKTIQDASIEGGNKAYRYPELIEDESLKVVFEPYALHAKAIIEQEERQSRTVQKAKKLQK